MRVEVIGSAVLDLQDKQRRCGVTGTRLQEASAAVHAAISVCTCGLDMECCKYQTSSSFQTLGRKGKGKKNKKKQSGSVLSHSEGGNEGDVVRQHFLTQSVSAAAAVFSHCTSMFSSPQSAVGCLLNRTHSMYFFSLFLL